MPLKARKIIYMLTRVYHVLITIARLFLYRPSIVVIEPNACHAEVVAGLAYLANMSLCRYACVINLAHKYESSEYFRFTKTLNIIYLDYEEIRLLLIILSNLSNIKILLSSSYDYFLQINIPGGWKYLNYRSPRVFAFQHDLSEIQRSQELRKMAIDSRLLSIMPSNLGHELHGVRLALNIPESSSKFTNYCSLSISKPIEILIPGTNGLDVSMLQNALLQIESYYSDVRIALVGKLGDISKTILKHADARGIIDFAGRISGTELVDKVISSSFIIGPTKTSSYVGGKRVSGCVQLSASFLKPLIINSRLAQEWQLPQSHVITYDGDTLSKALVAAISLTKSSYSHMTNALRTHTKHELESSVKVFSRALDLV